MEEYYSISWDCLYDGVHGTHTTGTLWAHSIAVAIMKNRSSTLVEQHTHDAQSPKRSWRWEEISK